MCHGHDRNLGTWQGYTLVLNHPINPWFKQSKLPHGRVLRLFLVSASLVNLVYRVTSFSSNTCFSFCASRLLCVCQQLHIVDLQPSLSKPDLSYSNRPAPGSHQASPVFTSSAHFRKKYVNFYSFFSALCLLLGPPEPLP